MSVLQFLHYQWFADFGHADAARAVAHLLSHGAMRDFGAAVQYLQQAADAGDPDAMAHLGHLYAEGIAPSEDGNATAWVWFWKAAELGAWVIPLVWLRVPTKKAKR
jgi:SEL1 protein